MKALIQNENGLLINGDSYTTPDTIRIDNTAYSFVVGSSEEIIIGDTNSGYMTALNEDGDIDQSVDLPVQYDLGTDLQDTGIPVEASGDETSTYTAHTYNSFDLAVTGVGTSVTNPRVLKLSTVPYTVGQKVLVQFDAVINSGTPILESVFIGNSRTDLSSPVVNGLNEVEVEVTVSDSFSRLYFDGTSTFDISVTNWTVKEVTNTNSYATYYDVDTKAFNTIDNPTGTTYNMTDSFSSYLTTDVPVTDGDRAKLNANANLIYDLWFGSTITGLSFTKANVINFIPATEGIDGGEYLQDLSIGGIEQIVNGDFAADTDWTKGNGWTIGGGEATTDGASGGQLKQAQTYEIGKSYLVVFDTVGTYDGLGLIVRIDGTTTAVYEATSDGSHSFVWEANTASAELIFRVPTLNAFVGSIDNVSIKEVSVYEIANYTDTCRTFYTDEVYGFQNVLADQDGSGRITGIADLTTVDMIEPLRVRSPDGTVWIITVDDLGVVSAVEEV